MSQGFEDEPWPDLPAMVGEAELVGPPRLSVESLGPATCTITLKFDQIDWDFFHWMGGQSGDAVPNPSMSLTRRRLKVVAVETGDD